MDTDTNIPIWEIAAHFERPVIKRTIEQMGIKKPDLPEIIEKQAEEPILSTQQEKINQLKNLLLEKTSLLEKIQNFDMSEDLAPKFASVLRIYSSYKTCRALTGDYYLLNFRLETTELPEDKILTYMLTIHLKIPMSQFEFASFEDFKTTYSLVGIGEKLNLGQGKPTISVIEFHDDNADGSLDMYSRHSCEDKENDSLLILYRRDSGCDPKLQEEIFKAKRTEISDFGDDSDNKMNTLVEMLGAKYLRMLDKFLELAQELRY